MATCPCSSCTPAPPTFHPMNTSGKGTKRHSEAMMLTRRHTRDRSRARIGHPGSSAWQEAATRLPVHCGRPSDSSIGMPERTLVRHPGALLSLLYRIAGHPKPNS
jgi:hypothetical protein